MIFFILLFGVASGYVAWPVNNCTEHVNYMVPYENDTILDPCSDGDCWTYCDHLSWHEDVMNTTEFSKEHLESDQKICVQTGCADFHYAHVKEVYLLETCAIQKCHVEFMEVERVRPCSILLIRASEMYAHVSDMKIKLDHVYTINRSIIEFSKHRFIHDVNTILDAEHDMIWDLELAATEMTKILEVKEPLREMSMLTDMRDALIHSVNNSNAITARIHEVVDSTFTMDNGLWTLLDQIRQTQTLSGALKALKEYMDDIRDRVVHQYIYGSDTCPDIDFLLSEIERECVLCEHGGCHFDGFEYSCTCDPGFKGQWCDQEKQDCTDNPCLQPGCINEYGSYRCECPSAWTGRWCHIEVDEVLGCNATGEAHPCQHSSSCGMSDLGYYCECPVGFEGRNCQYALTDCKEQNPCDHGQCVSDGYRISCDCPKEPVYKQPFWSGSACSYKQIECNASYVDYSHQIMIHGLPCSGHGLCSLDEPNNGWACFCDSAYLGARCSVSVDETDKCVLMNTPCDHGSCDHCMDAESCTCKCDPGYDGEFCTGEINECEPNPCANSAKCIDYVAEFVCDCSTIPGQFGGTLCNEKMSCAQAPCGEHVISCNDESSDISGIHCVCKPGWLGSRCEIDARFCHERVCLNGGNCVLGHSSGFCMCPLGWSGERCEHAPTYCDDDPCGSYGNCSVAGDTYICQCQEGWSGQQCNINIDDCLPNQCQHGACVDKINDYECLCESGWRGRNCEILKTPCDHVTCSNNGVCVDTRLETWSQADFECLCASKTCIATLAATHITHVPVSGKRLTNRLFWALLVIICILSFAFIFVIYVYCFRDKTKRTPRPLKPLRPIHPLYSTAPLSTI